MTAGQPACIARQIQSCLCPHVGDPLAQIGGPGLGLHDPRVVHEEYLRGWSIRGALVETVKGSGLETLERGMAATHQAWIKLRSPLLHLIPLSSSSVIDGT